MISESATVLEVERTSGEGRLCTILCEPENGGLEIGGLSTVLEKAGRRVAILRCRTFEATAIRAACGELKQWMESSGHKQTTLLAFGRAVAVGLRFGVVNSRAIRSLVLVNPGTEKVAPEFLHRIRCPVLLLRNSGGSPPGDYAYVREKLPTFWELSFDGRAEPALLAETINEFLDVPARCPQKRVNVK